MVGDNNIQPFFMRISYFIKGIYSAITSDENIALVADSEESVAYLGNGEFIVNHGGEVFGAVLLGSDATQATIDDLEWAGATDATFEWDADENRHTVAFSGEDVTLPLTFYVFC